MTTFLYWLLLFTVALAPLPLGSNRPYAWSLLALLIGFQLIAWGLMVQSRRMPLTLHRRHWLPIAVPFGLFCAWVVVQNASWTPEAWHHPFWQEASAALNEPLVGAMGLTPDDAMTTLLRILTYAGVFWLAVAYGRDETRARQSLLMVVLAVSAYALYGLFNYINGFERILWYEKWAYGDYLTSTFVNKNSYATYAGLGLLTAVGLFAYDMRRRVSRGLPFHLKVVRFLDSLNGWTWLSISMIVLIGASLVLTGSKGGIVSTFVALFVLLLFSPWKGELSRKKTLFRGLVAFVVTFAAIAVVIKGMSVLGDQSNGVLLDYRVAAQKVSIEAIMDAPLTGHGLGSYADVFNYYRNLEFGTSLATLYRAHNSYLELAIEVGLPAALLLFFSLFWMVLLCLQGLAQRHHNRLYPLMGIVVTVLVAVHAVLDFSMQMPGVAVTYFLIMGVAVAQSRSSQHSSNGKQRRHRRQQDMAYERSEVDTLSAG
ncbi:O-antigen ligase family protein [Rhodovibrionaceae bacterium A322]